MSDVRIKPIDPKPEEGLTKKELAEEALRQFHFTFDHMYAGQVLPIKEIWFWKALLNILDYLVTK